MKTFLKKHFVWAFALLISVATMSFKLVEANHKTSYSWFEVEPDGDIVGPERTSPPDNCGGSGPLCAVAFNPGAVTGGNPPISNVSHDAGHIQDETNKN